MSVGDSGCPSVSVSGYASVKAHFHYGCAWRGVALRGERYRDAGSFSISPHNAMQQHAAAIMEISL